MTLATARAVAEDVLLPSAAAVDRGRVPLRAGLDALATAGLFGLHGPRSLGGLDADPTTAGLVVEALAGGCLTTTFVWLQHHGAVRRLRAAGGELADEWLPALVTGRRRAGIAVGGVRPSRARPLVATPTEHGWSLDGTVPWVTGWGHVHTLLVAAVHAEGGRIVWLLVEPPTVTVDADGGLDTDTDSVRLHRIRTVACDAATSAAVSFAGHPVPRGRTIAVEPADDWAAADRAGLRTNGSLSLGVAARAGVLAGDERVARAVAAARDALDRATVEELPVARASAQLLAWDAAHALLVDTGARGVGTADHAQRLVREAALLQVFGTRPPIRDALTAAATARAGRDQP